MFSKTNMVHCQRRSIIMSIVSEVMGSSTDVPTLRQRCSRNHNVAVFAI